MEKQKTFDRQKQTGKFIAQMCENLPPMPKEVMQGWIQHPNDLKRALEGALLCPPFSLFPIWKTLKLGGAFGSVDMYCAALRKAGYFIGRRMSRMLDAPSFVCSKKETEVDLVIVSVAKLGFDGITCYADICARAIEMGLELCPAEVGLALRLAYDDQPGNDDIRIAMEGINVSSNGVSFFYIFALAALVGSGDKGLNGVDGSPQCCYTPSARFVFVRPRSA